MVEREKIKLEFEIISLVQVKSQIGPRSRYSGTKLTNRNATELLFDHNFAAVSTVNTEHTDGRASVSAANAACELLETLIFSFLLPPWCNSAAAKLTWACGRGTKLTTKAWGGLVSNHRAGEGLLHPKIQVKTGNYFYFSLVKRLALWGKADWTNTL